MVLVVSEKCSCGSRFEIRDALLADAKKLLREWRRSHECSGEDPADFVGSVAGVITDRDTIGFQRSNFSEEE